MAESLFAELRPLALVEKSEALQYWNEFVAHQETENVMWELESTDIDEYYERLKADERNRRFAFLIDGYMIGAVRISSRINYEADGKIEYSIRPTQRGNLYSMWLLHMTAEYWDRKHIEKYNNLC